MSCIFSVSLQDLSNDPSVVPLLKYKMHEKSATLRQMLRQNVQLFKEQILDVIEAAADDCDAKATGMSAVPNLQEGTLTLPSVASMLRMCFQSRSVVAGLYHRLQSSDDFQGVEDESDAVFGHSQALKREPVTDRSRLLEGDFLLA